MQNLYMTSAVDTDNKKIKDFTNLYRIMIIGSFLSLRLGAINEHTRESGTA